MGARSISTSDRRAIPIGVVGLLLVPVFLAGSSWFCSAGGIEGQLDDILQRGRHGVVRIEVRRPWNALVSDSSKVDQRFRPLLRVCGNGIIWDQAGHVITVADLAQPGDNLDVITSSGQRLKGTFLRQDPEAGLSLIQVNDLRSVAVPIDRDEGGFHAERGWVVMLAAPDAKSEIELALARVRRPAVPGQRSLIRLEGNLDPGLAGGSVLSGDGRLIGILLGEGDETLMLGEGARGMPIEFRFGRTSLGPSQAGWIVPIEDLESSANLLLSWRRSGEGFLGVRVDLSTAAKDGPPALGPGLPIARVLPGSPAEQAGMHAGDLLVGFGGLPVVSWDELTERVAATEPGRQVRIDVIRAGRPVAFRVKLADRGHMIWLDKQRSRASGRERILRRQIEDLRRELEFMRSRISPSR